MRQTWLNPDFTDHFSISKIELILLQIIFFIRIVKKKFSKFPLNLVILILYTQNLYSTTEVMLLNILALTYTPDPIPSHQTTTAFSREN